MLKAENIHKKFGTTTVLSGVSLHVDHKEIVSIVGKSGAGKTTLLQILGTILNFDSGLISFEGNEISRMNGSKLAQFRNQNLGFVFQFHQLLPEFSALENIMLPGLIAKKSKTVLSNEALALLDYFGLKEKRNAKPSDMSGGEQQRVAFARALINKPKLILADEPTGNLDSENTSDLQEMILDLRREFNQAFLIVTHNDHVANMADRKIVMADGLIVDEVGLKND